MDVERIRRDFPIYGREIKGKPILYMDSACMSLKPQSVIDAMLDYYQNHPACAGRSIHKLSSEVESDRKKAREVIRKFAGARKAEEIIFTRNTTEGLNLVLNSFPWNPGDVVLTTDREHNSSLIPCQLLHKRYSVRHEVVKSSEDHIFDFENFRQLLTSDVKLLSFVYTSNLDGYTLPIMEIIKEAHDAGVLVLLDAAQTAPHHILDVKKLNVDFLAFSGHKMLGPTGTGVLYMNEDHHETMQPFIVGGETVAWSTCDDYEFLGVPEKYEAGLQNYAGEVGLAAATEYLNSVGVSKIEKHEQDLTNKLHDGLLEIDGVKLIGVKDPLQRGGITSFSIEGVKYHDAAMILNRNYNIMVRSGQHCVHSWFEANEHEGSVRASFYLYNAIDEIESLLEAIRTITKLG
ncbi:MAG: aminotransferase class V-fold PLP-dependent enzyme [Candidatus Thorarchaeota archaeon]|jgi:cysteine desulfurase/selenocysteine lyase